VVNKKWSRVNFPRDTLSRKVAGAPAAEPAALSPDARTTTTAGGDVMVVSTG
jgi:hypothetical protein